MQGVLGDCARVAADLLHGERRAECSAGGTGGASGGRYTGGVLRAARRRAIRRNAGQARVVRGGWKHRRVARIAKESS